MDQNHLYQLFNQGTATLNLKKNDINGALDNFLDSYYFREGKELKIDSASEVVNLEGNTKTVTGTASFLSIPSMPVSAQFLSQGNDIETVITYTVIDSTKTSNFWKFSKSFPSLPLTEKVAGFSTSTTSSTNADSKQEALLDGLKFSAVEIIVSNKAYTHPEYGCELEAGINFIGKLKPTGIIGIATHLIDNDDEVVVFGKIKLPADDTALSLPELAIGKTGATVYPWEIQSELPGIHLQIALDCAFKVGSAQLKDTTMHLYCPLQADWTMRAEYYEPVIALTTTLDIPDADMAVDMIARNVPGAQSFFSEGRFDGFSIENIAKLAGISGNDGLGSELPDELQNLIKGVSKLELMDLAFGVGVGEKGLDVSLLTFSLGIPDVNWNIWDDHVVLTGLGTRFTINSPFKKPSFDIKLWGSAEVEGVALKMVASKASGWTFMAMLEEAQTLPLSSLMKRFTPATDAPADLTVDDMLFILAPKKGLRLTGSLAKDPGWTIDLGTEDLTLSNIKFDIGIAFGGTVDGQFRGDVSIGGMDLQFNYTIPGEFIIRAECDSISLNAIAKRFNNKKIVPSSFNPTIENSTLLIKCGKTDTVLQVGGTVGDVSAVFEAKKASGSWGYAAGLRLSDPQFSKLPGLDGLAPFEKIVDMQELTMVLASYESNDFRFPDMAAFSNPALTSHNMPMPTQAGGLQEGLNFYGKWKLNTEDKQQKLLKTMLGLNPELAVTLQVSPQPTKSSRLFISYNTKINNSWPLSCQLGFAMKNGTPEFFLAGQLQAKIQNKPCTFDVAMSMVSSGMYMGGTMKGTLAFGDLQVSNLAIMLGMNWGGIPSFGVAGMLSYPSFTGSVALLFDANNPAKSLVAGSVSDLSLLDVAEEFAKVKDIPSEIENVLDNIELIGTKPFYLPLDISEQLDNMELTAIADAFMSTAKISLSTNSSQTLVVVTKAGKKWHITDMPNSMMHYSLEKTKTGIKVSLDTQIYVAPQASQIGTLQFDQGFFLNGILNIMGFKWTAMVNVNARKGIMVDTYINKALTIYKPQLFKLSDAEGKTGPHLSLSTYNQPKHEIDKFRKPHLYISGKLQMLGIEVAETFVKVTDSGFEFSIEQNRGVSIGSKSLSATVMAGFEIDGAFNSITNFSAGGTATVAIKGKVELDKLTCFGSIVPGVSLGTISLNLSATGSIDVGYNGKEAYAEFDGEFEFQNQTFSCHKRFNVENETFDQIGNAVYDALEDVFTDFLDTAEEWAGWVENGLIEGIEEVEKLGKVFKDVYGKTAEEAAEILQDCGKTFDEIGDTLGGVFESGADEVAGVLNDIGAESEEIANSLAKTFNSSAKDISKALNSIGSAPDEISKALKNVCGESAQEVAKLLKDVGINTNDIAKSLKGTYKQTAKQAAKVLNDAGVAVNNIGGALKSIYKQPAKSMSSTLKSIGKDSTQVANVLKGSYKQTGKQAARILNNVKFGVNDVSKALKGTFKLNSKDMSKTLKSIGKNSKQISNALKKEYKQSAKQAAKVLNTIGFGINDVGNALKGTYKQSAKDAAKTLKGIGKNANQIAGVLSKNYKQSAKAAAKTLSDVGHSVDQIGGALRGTFKQSGEDAAKVFKSLGKNSTQVAKTLKNTFKMSSKGVGNCMRSVFKLGKNDLKSVLKGAGYASKEIDKFVGSAFKSVKKFFGL